LIERFSVVDVEMMMMTRRVLVDSWWMVEMMMMIMKKITCRLWMVDVE
jgi:hypothetical protein